MVKNHYDPTVPSATLPTGKDRRRAAIDRTHVPDRHQKNPACRSTSSVSSTRLAVDFAVTLTCMRVGRERA